MGNPVTSAGGVLFRREHGEILIAIVERDKGVEEKWTPALRQLPKGGCKPGETLEHTALREVLEETGFKARILLKAGEARWSYERHGQMWDETVHYYLMEPLTLIEQERDDEFDRVRWVRMAEAAQILSYPEERDLILSMIGDSRVL